MAKGGFGIQVKTVGLEDAHKALKRAFGYIASIEGVELKGSPRTSHVVHLTADAAFSGGKGTDAGGSANNAQVFHWLAASGRDFGAPDAALNKEIAHSVAIELQRQINRKNQNVDSAAASIYRKAMKVYRDEVIERIENGSAPGGVAPLSPAYSEWKKKAFGFTEPIGVATKQMLNEIATTGKIKLIKAAGAQGLKLPSLPKT